MTMQSEFPTRWVRLEEARAVHGPRVDRLGRFLWVGDPLADEAASALAELPPVARNALVERAIAGGRHAAPDMPSALARLIDHCEHVPFWFDSARADRGGAAILRSGVVGGIVLALKSLVLGYCSPGGNKPLILSGRLRRDAQRRVAETAHFVHALSVPGGTRRDAEGFRCTVSVRLVHAQMRRLLLASRRWDSAAWGTPISQADMAGTVLLFSHVFVEGLGQLGLALPRREADDILHLWRYAGYLMGVDEELLCADATEARTLFAVLSDAQAPPDDDARTLAAGLIESPLLEGASAPAVRRAVKFGYAISRFLIGDFYADHLAYPKTRWRYLIPALRALASGTDMIMRGVPGMDSLVFRAGMQYWEHALAIGLGGHPATFALPEALQAERSTGNSGKVESL
jgi:hypothetical protein